MNILNMDENLCIWISSITKEEFISTIFRFSSKFYIDALFIYVSVSGLIKAANRINPKLQFLLGQTLYLMGYEQNSF